MMPSRSRCRLFLGLMLGASGVAAVDVGGSTALRRVRRRRAAPGPHAPHRPSRTGRSSSRRTRMPGRSIAGGSRRPTARSSPPPGRATRTSATARTRSTASRRTRPTKLTFETYEDAEKQYRWRLKATNGQIIATSGQGYKDKRDCENAIDVIKKGAEKAKVEEAAAEWRSSMISAGREARNRRSLVAVGPRAETGIPVVRVLAARARAGRTGGRAAGTAGQEGDHDGTTAVRRALAGGPGTGGGSRVGAGRGPAGRGAERLLPAAGRAGGLADPAARRGGAGRLAEGADPRGRRGGLGRAQGGLGPQCRRARRDRAAGHPPRLDRRRVVQGRRPHDRVQHLLQLEVVHQHGVRLDPRPTSATARCPAARRCRSTPRSATPSGSPSRCRCPTRARRRSPSGNLLNMASGLGEENPPQKDHPFEWALGHVDGSPMARLKNDPGAAFHYSNAGVAHLVLVFHRAAGEDLYPFLKRRLFDPIGETQLRWKPLGGPEAGDGAIGPFSQGYSGIHTNPRQHAAVLLPGDAQGGMGRQADRPGVVLRLRLEGDRGQARLRRPVVDRPAYPGRPGRPGHDPGPQPQRRLRRPRASTWSSSGSATATSSPRTSRRTWSSRSWRRRSSSKETRDDP